MKTLTSILVFLALVAILYRGSSTQETSNEIELTAYDSICFEKMDLEEKYQPIVVDKFLAMKYGKDKMRWYDSTHAVYWVLDSIEHEEMKKSIIRDAIMMGSMGN